jgi:predicted metal-dependent enzyme (double-stranded beta helix superfamily)
MLRRAVVADSYMVATYIKRRAILTTTVGAGLGLLCALPAIGRRARLFQNRRSAAANTIDWESFLALVETTAGRALREKSWNQDQYVKDIVSLTSRLTPQTEPIADAIRSYKDEHPGWPERGVLESRQMFQVTLMGFEPGESIPHHNHPEMTSVGTCLIGRVEISKYDLLPKSADVLESSALLRAVAREELTPGDSSTLTSNSGNIHSIRAMERSEILEVFTPPYNTSRVSQIQWFTVESDPYKGQKDVFQAVVSDVPPNRNGRALKRPGCPLPKAV